MSEVVTLPRRIVEQVLDVLSTTHNRGHAEQWKLEGVAMNALRVALESEPEICNKSCAPGYCYCEELERQQNHGEQVLDMVPAGWRLVPVEPTPEMMLSESSCKHHEWDDKSCSARQTRRSVWATMLAAAPQLPDAGIPASGAPHVAQEPVAWEWRRPVMTERGTVTLPRKAIEDAMYVIEAWSRGCDHEDYFRDCADALEPLRASLEAKQEAGSVDWQAVAADQAKTIALLRAELANRQQMSESVTPSHRLEAVGSQEASADSREQQEAGRSLIVANECVECGCSAHDPRVDGPGVRVKVTPAGRSDVGVEPAAWRWMGRKGWIEYGPTPHDLHASEPLFLRTPTGLTPLTDDEIDAIWSTCSADDSFEFARALERAHGIRSTK